MKVLSDEEECEGGECNGKSENDLEELSLQGIRKLWLQKDCLISDFLSYLTEYQG